MWEKIVRFYPPWLELIPVVLLIFAFGYSAANYPLLPEQVPTHFGFAGTPDAWRAKGFASVYLPPVMAAIIWLSMALMNYFLIMGPEDPGKCINLPQRQKEQLGPAKLEAIRTTTARGMMLINLTVIATITILQYGSINTALGLQKGLGIIAAILALVIIAESIGLTVKTIAMTFNGKKKL